MKILRIIARLNVGGPARHAVWLTKELNDGEFQSVLIAGTVPEGEEDMQWFAEKNNVQPFYLKEMSRELSLNDISSLLKLYRIISKEQPDIIHTHTAKAGTLGRCAAFFYRFLTWRVLIGRPRRVRIVHTFHGHIFHSYYGRVKTKIFLLIEKILARIATDKIIVISKLQFSQIYQEFKIGRKEQFAIIPLGIDLEPFADESEREKTRKEFGIQPGEILVGFIGRLTEIKNLSLLLQTAEIYKKNPPELPVLKFIIIGDGRMREALEQEAGKRGITDIISFIGNRTDVERLYSSIDIIALTSLNEGTPLSLIEGMAAGKPAVATDVGGVPDLLGNVVEDKGAYRICERGIAVDSKNVKAYAGGFLHLAKDEKLRERISTEGRQFVHARFGKDRLVADIKSLYKDLINK